jgi:hypothetical protein
MAFKMKMGKLSMDNTPIYQVDLDGDIMGEAHNNGSILVDKNLSPEVREDAIRHEKVHLDQMKRGDLAYDDEFVYWKGKKYPRSKMDEGNKNLPWEKEAWKANKLNYS